MRTTIRMALGRCIRRQDGRDVRGGRNGPVDLIYRRADFHTCHVQVLRDWLVCRKTVGTSRRLENMGSPRPCPTCRGRGTSAGETRRRARLANGNGHGNGDARDAARRLALVDVLRRLLAKSGGRAAVATVSGWEGAVYAWQRLGAQPTLRRDRCPARLSDQRVSGVCCLRCVPKRVCASTHSSCRRTSLLPDLPRSKGASTTCGGAVSEGGNEKAPLGRTVPL